MTQIFVFGSNLAGVHGAGAARIAATCHGARYRVGVGRTGNAYAIPTKDMSIRTLPLRTINGYVQGFCDYAGAHLDDTFYVTRIGCGLAGHKDSEIAPMFRKVPYNCVLPIEWKPYLDDDVAARVTFHNWDAEQRQQARA